MSVKRASDAAVDFIESASFQGAKIGYIFRAGQQGVGYYFDLYEGERKISHKTKNEPSNDDAGVGNVADGHGLVTVDISKTLLTLKSHLGNLRKFSKAVDLTAQLFTATLAEDNANFFFDFLKQIQFTVFTDTSSKVVRDGCMKIINLFFERRAVFSIDHQYQILTWHLSKVIQFQLQTDDSFQFAAASKQLQETIEMFSGVYNNSNVVEDISTASPNSAELPECTSLDEKESAYRDRISAVLQCMEVSFRSYSRDWAKECIDRVFAAAASKRLALPDDLREKLDDLTTAITYEQRKAASGGGSSKTIRTYDSVAHPLLQKRVGILR